ncbi:hypothetical protein [Variovorax sp. OV329]|uniref:hypothetical protein n=1 Tax=Variovorax sp. OV329 TaxID=1882825 RepID=UPI0008E6BB03|nr:hypothetical protein [Variovorax sp. OV329]SFM03545.1 hypothetical protein SAMN05444747_10298 [Variovorax sp. OV329]
MRSLAYITSVALIAASAALAGMPQAQAQTASQREAAAATQAKSQGQLNTKGQDQYQQNALRRCERQPAGAARESCQQRVMGQGNTTTTGSVQSGGILSTNELPAKN